MESDSHLTGVLRLKLDVASHLLYYSNFRIASELRLSPRRGIPREFPGPQNMCGPQNSALYGLCIASSAKYLFLFFTPSPVDAVQPALPFILSVQKQDFYGQLISSDSSSYVEVHVVAEEHDIDPGVSISGTALLKLHAGVGNISIGIKPVFTVASPQGIVALSSKINLIVRGQDAETLSPLSSNSVPISIAEGIDICPPGFIVVLEPQISPGAGRRGACTYCLPGTYSVNPLYSVTGNASNPACLNCPTAGVCSGGKDVVFRTGGWIISEGMYSLVSCPKGHALLNQINGIFSHDNQQCVQCSADEYILDSNSSRYACQQCPIGGICDGSSLTEAVEGSVWEQNMELGQYILISCPAGYELLNTIRNGVFSHLDQECVLCPVSHYCEGGNVSRRPCPVGSFAAFGANSSSMCISVVFVSLSVTFPLRQVDFNTESQGVFRAALAYTCDLPVGQIVIDEMVQARRSSAPSLRVTTRIATQDSEAAKSLSARLNEDALNKQLSRVGLPRATLLSLVIQDQTAQSSYVPWSLIIGTVVGGCVVLFALLAVLVLHLFKRVESHEERELRQKMAELRTRLKISKKDGYVLSKEGGSMWRQDYFIMQSSYLEAAARLALSRDFEVNQFDAFCLCVECGGSMDDDGPDSAYAAVLDWLLEVSTELIRPEMPVVNSKAVGDGGTRPGNGCRLRVEERFPYFTSKVCKARIWEDDGGLLFERLRVVARNLMDEIALLCDERFESLCVQPGGASLTAFFATPESAFPLAAGHILRQDHDEVRSE
jgi:hypothetical protein